MYTFGISCKPISADELLSAIEPKQDARIKNINPELRHSINKAKLDIELVYHFGDWDFVKTLTNPYELIYPWPWTKSQAAICPEIIRHGCCDYEPLSRSFFKMVEMGNVFLVDRLIKTTSRSIKSLHLAEGPGGFIEGLLYLRKQYVGHLQPGDLYYGMTLLDKSDNIPGWKKSARFLHTNPNVILLNGHDGTGDLYVTENLKYLRDRFHSKMDLVTADGGFDFSVNYNSQEYLSSRLIFAEIIGAFATLRHGGAFICKMFDMINRLTVDFIYLLQCKFHYIHIYKPKTSRLANSEKYVICLGFQGCSTAELDALLNIAHSWPNKKYNNMISLFKDLPPGFLKYIEQISSQIVKKQVENIKETIELMEKITHKEINTAQIAAIIQTQTDDAKRWCRDNKMKMR